MKIRLLLGLFLVGCGIAVGASSCGGDDSGTTDGGPDVTVTDGGGGDSNGCMSNCGPDGSCTNLGVACSSSAECCSGNCVSGSCQPSTCTADNQACTTDVECCSKTCTGGKCAPIPCAGKALGNPCTVNSDCCSQFCQNKICAQPSYCGQFGDVCEHNADCCGGLCVVAQGKTFGTCSQPPQSGAQCSAVDGTLCQSALNGDAGLTDAGLPACGGDCCSRDCAPWGPTKMLICQPASGCHPVGDICTKDSDCCGGQGTNPQETCNKANASDPVGVCSNPTQCKPNGDICRLQTNQCNATDNCCSGNVQKYNTCHQDNLGVPRCSYAGDAGCIPVDAGTQCATSADCCNLNPCVPDGDGGFTCYPSSCVPTSGVCTNDADCCPGGHCYIPGGQTSGTCQPLADGGTCDAGLYGQTCTTNTDCCNGVPCTAGRCEYPIPN